MCNFFSLIETYTADSFISSVVNLFVNGLNKSFLQPALNSNHLPSVCGDDEISGGGLTGGLSETHGYRQTAHFCGD